MIIDDNLSLCESISDYLNDTGKFHIAGTAHDADEGLRMLEEIQPDVALIDLVLPLGDGISILEQLRKKPNKKKTALIVLTAMGDDNKTRQVMELGAQHYILKPFSFVVLSRRIEEAYEQVLKNETAIDFPVDEQSDHEKYVSSLLLNLGIPTHLKGFSYLKRAIILTDAYYPRVESLTKIIYPILAKEYKTTPINVERAIRHAIHTAWEKGMAQTYYQLLGYFPNQEKKPSNGAFIFSLTELVKNNIKEDS